MGNEMMEESGLEIAYTIERHLMMFAKSESTSERHQVLWHTWNSNKRWLSQLLEWTLPSFPTYSRHNAVHADTVLYNIERILGEKRIRQLTATDCFMLLHASYMHDIGMSITAEERLEMTGEDRFRDLVQKLEKEGDVDQRKAAESLLRTHYTEYDKQTSRKQSKRLKELFQEKLDVYYGLGQLMSEYQRSLHADKVKERMNQWTLNPEDLGTGFSSSGIPLRLFLRIADCAAIHATSGIEAVLALPQKDSGYVLDVVHPRFIAVMLQLGDALDIDNDRFHPFAYQFAGNFPRTSTLHLKKHQSIRQLNITPEAIQIQADCDSQDVLRIVRMECEEIDEILKNASYHWAEIAPSAMSGCLPTLSQQQILLEGQRVPAELVKAQFNISQVRAFRLLEGANVYDGHFVFLRELIQNAIDATKLQCWEDYVYKSRMKEGELLNDEEEVAEYGLDPSEEDVLKEVKVWDYPIELRLEIGLQIRNENEELEFVPIEELDNRRRSDEQKYKESQKYKVVQKYREGTYGVRIFVRDHGTGITKDDLIKISHVGSSYEEKKHFVERMPDWLKPTGQFGIGLQSVFLVSDSITARTYTRSGEKYEISFNKVSNGSGGYINVKPLPNLYYVPFGTTFELFLDVGYKKLHADCWEAWNTDSADTDRFSSDYDERRPLRHSMELLTQIVLSVDEMLGENIFPIYVYIKGHQFSVSQYDFIKSKVSKVMLMGDVEEKWQEEQERKGWADSSDCAKKSEAHKKKGHHAKNRDSFDEKKEDYVGWLFQVLQSDRKRDENLIVVNIKDGIAALDCRTAKLHIWNSAKGVFARFGGHRLLSADSSVSKKQEKKWVDERKIRIYLKGIYVQSYYMYQDSELLELIDIKGGSVDRTHIAINRNEFTQEGIRYLEDELYPSLLSSVKEALVELNERANQEREEFSVLNEKSGQRNERRNQHPCFDELIERAIQEKFQACMEDCVNEKKLVELEELVLSAIGLSYFLRILGKEQGLLCEKNKKEQCHWDKLLERIVRVKANWALTEEGDGDKRTERGAEDKKANQYINRGMLRDMPIYSYRDFRRNRTEYRSHMTNYPRMLLEGKWVAVASMRTDENSRWFYIPIEINREIYLDGFYDAFLGKANSYEEEQEAQEQLEHWADGICSALASNGNFFREEYGDNSEIQYTLRYIVENIPTVGVFANDDGNVRVNVVLGEQPQSVFYSRNAKLLVLKKAHSLYDRSHAKRFVTGVWRGYDCLALARVPSSVHVANGVYIARQQKEYMLLPLLGENVEKLLYLEQQPFFSKMKEEMIQCRQLKRLCDDYCDFEFRMQEIICGSNKNQEGDELYTCLHEKLKSELFKMNLSGWNYSRKKSVAMNYWQELMNSVLEFVRMKFHEYESAEKRGEQVIPTVGELISGKRDEKRKIRLQMLMVEILFAHRDDVRLYIKDEVWIWFTKSLYYIKKHQNDEFMKEMLAHPEVERFRESLWGTEKGEGARAAKENMVEYIAKNAKQDMTEKQVVNCYENMFDEIILSIIGVGTEKSDERFPHVDFLIR